MRRGRVLYRGVFMFCKYCGAQAADGAKFCENCGRKLSDNINCAQCGNEILSDAQICPSCGYYQNSASQDIPSREAPPQNPLNTIGTDRDETLKLVIKIFLIFGCISFGWLLVPLLWCIPLTTGVFNRFKTGEPVPMGTKICILLFVNVVAGVCLLCLDDD